MTIYLSPHPSDAVLTYNGHSVLNHLSLYLAQCFILNVLLTVLLTTTTININLTQYTFKVDGHSLVTWAVSLSPEKSCLVTNATCWGDLVWAATLHRPCYDSADGVEKTMNSHGDRWEQTGEQGRASELHISGRCTHRSPYGGIKAGLKSSDLLSVWRGLTATALIRQTEF